MPFTKVGKNDYTSPSGRHFNTAQVRLYHANGDKFPGQKEKTMASADYAKGGAVLGRTKDFMKTPDRFRDSQFKKAEETDDQFGKSGKGNVQKGKDKSLSPVKPRSK